ncbi:MAG: hypothetical protein R2851_15910 [Caldilineaceae bacterium]
MTGAGWLLLDLLLLMTALPVLLLFLATAVPRVWSLALVAVLAKSSSSCSSALNEVRCW